MLIGPGSCLPGFETGTYCIVSVNARHLTIIPYLWSAAVSRRHTFLSLTWSPAEGLFLRDYKATTYKRKGWVANLNDYCGSYKCCAATTLQTSNFFLSMSNTTALSLDGAQTFVNRFQSIPMSWIFERMANRSVIYSCELHEWNISRLESCWILSVLSWLPAAEFVNRLHYLSTL